MAGGKTQLVAGERDWAQVILVVSLVPYAANDVIGGRIQFKGMGKCRLQSILIADNAAQNVNYLLVLFRSVPTDIADNLTFDIADADLRNIIYQKVIDAATYRQAFTDNSIHLVLDLDVPLESMESDDDIWGFLIGTTAPTYVATTDVTVVLGFERE